MDCTESHEPDFSVSVTTGMVDHLNRLTTVKSFLFGGLNIPKWQIRNSWYNQKLKPGGREGGNVCLRGKLY